MTPPLEDDELENVIRTPSLVRPEDSSYEHGMPPAYRNQEALLRSQSDIFAESAIGKLQKALEARSGQISPSQGIAAALLAAIPTVGGYLVGKSVGAPDIPEGVYFPGMNYKEFSQMAGGSGAAAGGIAGSQIGARASGSYLGSIEKAKEAEADTYEKLAKEDSQRAAQIGNRADTTALAGLAAQERRDLIPLEEASKIRLLNQKPKASSEVEAELSNPEKKAAFNRIGTKEELPGDRNLLSVAAVEKALDIRKTGAYVDSSEFYSGLREGQTKLAGYKNYSDAVLTPSQKKEIDSMTFGTAKTKQLLEQYVTTPDVYTGNESAIQGALHGLLMNAQRYATGSGANFTETEQKLVSDALIASQAGNLAEWVKRNLLGRDQKQFAKDLINIYEKSHDYAIADTYGQFRTDVPSRYYPEKLLQKYRIDKARFDAESTMASTAATTPSPSSGGVDKSSQEFEEIKKKKLEEARAKRGLPPINEKKLQ